jgi:hypothetical protein
VEVEGLPGKVFTAVISSLEPTLNDAARTVKVRADIKNSVVTTNGRPQRLLRFGMYAEGRVRGEVPEVLAVPRTAILFPGGAAYVYVDNGNGAFERRRVKLGRQGDELWEVLQGLEEGDRVVTSGNVLIDAQAQFNQGSNPDDAFNKEVTAVEPQDDQAMTAGGLHQDAGAHIMPANQLQEMPVMAMDHTPAQPVVATSAGMPGRATDVMPSSSAQPVAAAKGMQVSTNKALTHLEVATGRMALRDELRLMRTAAIVEAIRQKTEAQTPPAEGQPKAIGAFLKVADEISQALASDNLEQFKQCVTNLASVLPPLEKEFVAPHRWSGPIQRLATLPWQPAKELGEARKQFLPFSTVAVEWAKELRKEDPAFASLKIYHCPMAPKPGLWLQAKGPLANPFYGAEMLRCGTEVKP